MQKHLRASPAKIPFGSWYLSWYKTFPTDHFGQIEIDQPTRMSNKTRTAYSRGEDQILEHLILRTNFETFVLKDIKTLSGNLATKK